MLLKRLENILKKRLKMYKIILTVGDGEYNSDTEIECETIKEAEDMVYILEKCGTNVVCTDIEKIKER